VSVLQIGRRIIGEGHPTFVVAEVGSNHNRDFELALQLIDAAAASGADAVKFQLFRAERLYPKNVGVIETPMCSVELFDTLRRYELPVEWLRDLKQRAEEKGLLFLCTPFDEALAEALDVVGLDVFKIASPELCHWPLLRRVASFGRPVILSTGLSTL